MDTLQKLDLKQHVWTNHRCTFRLDHNVQFDLIDRGEERYLGCIRVKNEDVKIPEPEKKKVPKKRNTWQKQADTAITNLQKGAKIRMYHGGGIR